MAKKKQQQPNEKWIRAMIKDEKEGIKKYSGKKGYSAQAKQEKAHLKKLQKALKKVKH